MIKRNLITPINEFALRRNKMAFLSGPRQCGKTTLSQQLIKNKNAYFNWDDVNFKRRWIKSSKEIANDLLAHSHPQMILDEFHKNKNWKNQLKGFFDTYGDNIQIIGTGSAKLNVYRKGQDSLLGRFNHFHVHPFSLGEICASSPMSFSEFMNCISKCDFTSKSKNESFEIQNLLLKFTGFPEPFTNQSDSILNLWTKNRLELLVREDIAENSNLLRSNQVDMLALLLPERVGSPLSIQSLREDLDVAHTTVSRWISALAQVYYHFEVRPYSKNIARALKKEAKIFLYDWSQVTSEGARFENLVAIHLKKMIDYYNDTGQADLSLHYLRNKDGHEVDFLLANKGTPILSIEAKWQELNLDKSFQKFRKNNDYPHIQIVGKKDIFRVFRNDDASVISFDIFFRDLP